MSAQPEYTMPAPTSVQHVPVPSYVREEDAPSDFAPKAATGERARFHQAASVARVDYPGVVGEFLGTELSYAASYAMQYTHKTVLYRLVEFLLKEKGCNGGQAQQG